ncbi:glycosyltransferase [Pseudonocardia endophytica]|nr:glycosyltransferase [Pseudonocardia endophytica]
MNPRCLTTWLLVLLRRILGRRTLGWGHAFPRSGPDSGSDRVRSVLRSLCGEVCVYTFGQRRQLLEHQPKIGSVYVVPNATQRRVNPVSRGRRINLLYCGRLSVLKRPDLLVEAYACARASIPSGARLVIIGSGPMEERLRALVRDLGVEASVDFEGAVSDSQRLKGFYQDALVSVSPGYVGLALTQSLAFGVPMIIADDEPHAPEVELANSANSRFFNARSKEALSEEIVDVFRSRDDWIESSVTISNECQQYYTAEAMAKSFVAAATRRDEGHDSMEVFR